ncbi:MAG: hypothetical protein M0C28_18210 [Candidatus Moduliflexus flocculans]|nr:hypothetical protein [Candidatus Moduliflexus flocculans]
MRGRGRVVLARHAGAQRGRPRAVRVGLLPPIWWLAALVAGAVALAWVFRLPSDRAKPLLFSAVARRAVAAGAVACRLPDLGGALRVARLGGDALPPSSSRVRCRLAGSTRSAPASPVPRARRGWRSSVRPSSTTPRRGALRRSCPAAMSRTTSSSPRACGATATCASRTTISEATTSSSFGGDAPSGLSQARGRRPDLLDPPARRVRHHRAGAGPRGLRPGQVLPGTPLGCRHGRRMAHGLRGDWRAPRPPGSGGPGPPSRRRCSSSRSRSIPTALAPSS